MTLNVMNFFAEGATSSAAGVQALLSGIGILVAALMPLYFARASRKNEIKRIVEIFRVAQIHADKAAEIRDQLGNPEIVNAQVNLWEGMKDAFASIPAHKTPDVELFQHIVVGRNAVARIYGAMVAIQEDGFSPSTEGEIMVSRLALGTINDDLRDKW